MNSFIAGLFNLTSKNIVVLGVQDIYALNSVELIKSGANVFIIDKSSKKNKNLINELKNLIINDKQIIKYYTIDTTKYSQQKSVFLRINKLVKNIDVLINGSGINSPINFLDIKLNDWNDVLNSHILSTFISCQLYGKK